MTNNAIGMIETMGYVSAFAAADAMVKAAEVTLVGRELVATGLVSITVSGDVGAVQAATAAGAEAAAKTGQLISTHVIARPESEVGSHFSFGDRTAALHLPVSPSAATSERKVIE